MYSKTGKYLGNVEVLPLQLLTEIELPLKWTGFDSQEHFQVMNLTLQEEWNSTADKLVEKNLRQMLSFIQVSAMKLCKSDLIPFTL